MSFNVVMLVLCVFRTVLTASRWWFSAWSCLRTRWFRLESIIRLDLVSLWLFWENLYTANRHDCVLPYPNVAYSSDVDVGRTCLPRWGRILVYL